jgi:hypothetical protein
MGTDRRQKSSDGTRQGKGRKKHQEKGCHSGHVPGKGRFATRGKGFDTGDHRASFSFVLPDCSHILNGL